MLGAVRIIYQSHYAFIMIKRRRKRMLSKEAKTIDKVLHSIGTRKSISRKMLNPKKNNRYEEPPKVFIKNMI